VRAELTEGLDVKHPGIWAGGTRSEYRSRIFWIDGRRTRAAAKAPQRGKGRVLFRVPLVDPNFFASVRAQLVATDGWRTAGT